MSMATDPDYHQFWINVRMTINGHDFGNVPVGGSTTYGYEFHDGAYGVHDYIYAGVNWQDDTAVDARGAQYEEFEIAACSACALLDPQPDGSETEITVNGISLTLKKRTLGQYGQEL